jgi:adenosylmethionine-8-amino-7-oxononanoate aminotransferase
MSKVFHRTADTDLPVAVSGEGIWITDRNGQRYMDASSGGVGLTCLGYSHPKVAEALARQAATLPFIHPTLFTTDPLEALAEELVDHAPAGLTRAFFTSGGSEAIEAAVMIAKQAAVAMGQPKRNRIISRDKSFHGGTTMTLGIADHKPRKKILDGILPDAIHISAPYGYRDSRDGETPEAYGLRIADELEAAILAAQTDSILCFIAETVCGGGYGALTPPAGYYKRIREICDRHGIFFILDEVYCGLGRTGTLHACEQDGVVPDLLVVAKGLAAGFAPIGAVLVSGPIHQVIAEKTGSFGGGFTHSGHALSCAAALAVQTIVREEKLVANAATQGRFLRDSLETRFGNHRHVGEVRGRGLMQAIELVADRGRKDTFDPALKIAPRISAAARARGLICWVGSGTVDGTRGEHVMLSPAFIVTPQDVEEIVGRLGEAVDAVLQSL